ncbi:1923_t:CDS:2 [Racocetra fulgida]|uniref:1923_t:CDS:1 n=1 Tax=Racocetra fulgida TaxID=60492 RepID=A0A9N9AZ13_9GLOM|nr:1923_t:CDS:2 [Racocetra fulgida]
MSGNFVDHIYKYTYKLEKLSLKMDLDSKLTEAKRQFESGEINEDEFKERKKLILEKWLDQSKETNQLEHSHETDLYTVLQLTPRATENEIKSSYRKLALKYHPDKNGGVETEEAYQILSEKNSRDLYDNCGTVSSDLWKPYIGDLEIGLWIHSFDSNNSSPELEHVTSVEQKERRHVIRVSNIIRHLQDKLSQFPEQDNPSEFEPFKQSLYREAQKLLAEPNGKELLSLLGEIYISEAKTHQSSSSRNIFSKNMFSNLFNGFIFTWDLINGVITNKTNNGSGEEAKRIKVAWRLSRSEISSITYEACKKVLNNTEYSMDKRNNLANSLYLLGKLWVECANTVVE